ncbi:MAG: glycerol-3-phosphate dehydrogenase [SAR324 cluster bacterium]
MDYDVAVVGGGINGAGVAREAAYRGYRTILLEKYDYAQATSSQSTKLIHGGLRYLETAQIRLVWESLRERRILLSIAPHLVHPLELVVPIYEGSPRPPWMIRIGTLLYDLLAGRHNLGRSRSVGAAELARVPFLRQQGLRGAVAYFDAQTLDSRLTLETILSAREAGAETFNYRPVLRVRADGSAYLLEGIDRRSGQAWQCRARCLVNATGPWAPFFERDTLRHPTPPIVYDRGIHFVIPSLGIETGLYLMVSDRRLVFVLPWRKRYTLIGTTETQFTGDDFAHVPPSEQEIEYLLQVFNEFFPRRALKREEVLHIYSGVRALIAPKGGTMTGASRESEVAVFSDGPGLAWVVVYGGKLTSYRGYAVHILDRIARRIGAPPSGRASPLPLSTTSRAETARQPRRLDTATSPLYGAVPPPGPEGAIPPAGAQERIWQMRYGTRWHELARRVREQPALAEELVPSHGFTRADLEYLLDVEQAYLLEDIALRRTKLIYDMSPAEAARLREALGGAVRQRGWRPEAAG